MKNQEEEEENDAKFSDETADKPSELQLVLPEDVGEEPSNNDDKDDEWYQLLNSFNDTKDTLLSTRREAAKLAIQPEAPILKESPNDPILISAASASVKIDHPSHRHFPIKQPPHIFYSTRDPVIAKRAEAARKFPFLTARYPEIGSSHSFTPRFQYVANFHRRACEEREQRLDRTLNELSQSGLEKPRSYPLIGESFNERIAKHDRLRDSRLEAYIEDYVRPEEFASFNFKPIENSLGRVLVKSRDKQIQEVLMMRNQKELARLDSIGQELNKKTLQLMSQQDNLVDFLNHSHYLRKPYWPY